MKLINARQIKAARALVDWSQDDLAQASGLSIATIRNIEAGQMTLRASTHDQLLRAFEGAGVEFTDYDGVRRKPEDIVVYNGHEGTVAFFDDVYQTVHVNGGEIVVVCISEEPFTQALGEYQYHHLARMLALGDRASVKCIITENFDNRPAKYCEYRSISKDFIDSVPFYIYGDNYAIFLFDAQPSPKIIVHKSKLLADAYRKQFNSMWDRARILSVAEKQV